jgi:hypothetical protein
MLTSSPSDTDLLVQVALAEADHLVTPALPIAARHPTVVTLLAVVLHQVLDRETRPASLERVTTEDSGSSTLGRGVIRVLYWTLRHPAVPRPTHARHMSTCIPMQGIHGDSLDITQTQGTDPTLARLSPGPLIDGAAYRTLHGDPPCPPLARLDLQRLRHGATDHTTSHRHMTAGDGLISQGRDDTTLR